jgi:DNA-binding NtrC family response regulator
MTGNTLPKLVLIVDDEPNATMIMAASVEKLGEEFIVETAANGDEALAKVRENHVAMLITDYMMPGMDGLELAQAVREISPDTEIALVTGYGTQRLRDRVEQLHLAGYLDKPFTMAQIRELVQRTVQDADTIRRVLILEDEDDLRRLYGKALRHAGFDVYEAATVQAARDLLTEQQFAAFLCDIRVGGDRGTDLLREQFDTLRENGTQLVMVSAEGQYRGICEDMGAEFFMEKPIALGPLITLVDRLTA